MTTVTLCIGERFDIEILIDISTFHFYGHTAEYSDARVDAGLSFVPAISKENDPGIELLAEKIRMSFKIREELKEEYIKVRYPDQYESDKRPRLWIRLPSGYRGLANPAHFHFKV